jgi:hypothetical protein
MSGHWMDGADKALKAALDRNAEIARGLAGMAEPPIHAQDDERKPGPDFRGKGHTNRAAVLRSIGKRARAQLKRQKSEREPDCRDLAAGLATAAREVE